MKVRLLCLFIYTYHSVLVDSYDEADAEEANRKKILEQLTRTRTVLLDGYHLVTRQVATDVYMFRSYRTVSVVFYPVTRDVSDARFMFQAEELHLNTIGSCEPKEVIVNIKHGSYPAVNPDGYDFPEGFIEPGSREEVHTLEFLSDGRNQTYSLENPRPGNWYALVYIKWEDPRTQKVEQQGLTPLCQTILYTDLQIKREGEIAQINCYTGEVVDYAHIPSTYKCIANDSNDVISLNLNITNIPATELKIGFKLQALSLPTKTEYLVYCTFDPRLNSNQTISFYPHPNSWHYISLEILPQNETGVRDCDSYFLGADLEEVNGHDIQDLMRDDKGRFFTFDYGLPTTDLQDSTSLVNLTSSEITSVRYKVNQHLDIGGTLAIQTVLLMNPKYYGGYKRKYKTGSLLAFSDEDQFFRVVVCLDIGHTSVPLKTGHCKYNDHVRPAIFVLNSTDSQTIDKKTVIPYPDSGTWYLTFRIFCDNVVCPCNVSDSGSQYYVGADSADEDYDVSTFGNGTRMGVAECNATVMLSVSSTSCVNGRCSNHGSCQLNTFGGLVMSFCSCSSGYGGWDCSDDSRMDSRTEMLISVLLLTLSNLLFIISVYVALIRLYHTEAMMYFFTMIFSTFYHACDAPVQVAYCVTRGNILQFGDFYSGLMSFWVTLLAMSVMSEKGKSFLQLIGAIVIALLTTWNMHSIVSFMLPVAVGITVVFVSWFVSHRKQRSWIYPRSYYSRYMPIGLILVGFGLICYAFLQTEQNYKIVHSFWHMVIAVSVVFLLPDVRRRGDNNPFLPNREYFRLPLCNIFKASPNTMPD